MSFAYSASRVPLLRSIVTARGLYVPHNHVLHVLVFEKARNALDDGASRLEYYRNIRILVCFVDPGAHCEFDDVAIHQHPGQPDAIGFPTSFLLVRNLLRGGEAPCQASGSLR